MTCGGAGRYNTGMRVLSSAAAVVGLVLALTPGAGAWGFVAHRHIADRMIALLPAELRPLFEARNASSAPLIHYLPWAALAALLLAYGLWTRHAVTRLGISRRRALLTGMIAGALPTLYVALAWAGAVSDVYLRFARPWVTLLSLLATAFIAARLAGRRQSAGPSRIAMGDALTMLAAITAALAAAGPEIGRPLDRRG